MKLVCLVIECTNGGEFYWKIKNDHSDITGVIWLNLKNIYTKNINVHAYALLNVDVSYKT